MRERTESTPAKKGRALVVYDGECGFCSAQARRLDRLGRGRLEVKSFHDEGVLGDHPGLTARECAREIKLVAPDGRVYGGVEAIVRAIRLSRPFLGSMLQAVYSVRVVRWLADRLYAWVARHRYRIGTGASSDGPP